MTRNRKTRPMGFTLIELLVVIAIIAILIGLLIPAVQKVLAQSYKSTSQNNVKQMSLGAVNLAMGTSNQLLPPASGTLNGVGPYTFFTHILPFIEQQNIYNNLATSTASPIKTYYAPADPFNPSTNATVSYAANNVALLGTATPKISSLGRTSSIILVFERTWSSNSATWNTTTVGNSAPYLPQTAGGAVGITGTFKSSANWLPGEPTAITPAGIVCGFGDGHASTVSQGAATTPGTGSNSANGFYWALNPNDPGAPPAAW